MSIPTLGAGGSSGSGPAPLSVGIYWAVGNNAGAPNSAGGWAKTTSQDDGSAGDTTTRDTSTGDTISIMDVRAADQQLTSASFTLKYRGTLTLAEVYYHNGSSWVATGAISGFGLHASYVDETATVTPGGTIAPSKYWKYVFTESTTASGNMSSSDYRPTF